MNETQSHRLLSRRRYLLEKVLVETQTSVTLAQEAIASTAIEHPEWDLDELDTWEGWEARPESE